MVRINIKKRREEHKNIFKKRERNIKSKPVNQGDRYGKMAMVLYKYITFEPSLAPNVMCIRKILSIPTYMHPHTESYIFAFLHKIMKFAPFTIIRVLPQVKSCNSSLNPVRICLNILNHTLKYNIYIHILNSIYFSLH